MRQYQRAIDDYTNAVKHGREQSPKYLQARASAYEQWGRKDLAEQDRKAALKSVEDVMLDR
jgi:tetratricopeptide (TPR) repeat protein